ncbi:MAG: YbaN family protein [Treponema sp.]|nr:YbaN family protein [Treponema sp.]
MSIVNGLFVAAGFLFLGLGIVGIALPVLPTTPFLLLASFCFLKGSKRLHRWLMTNKHFGPRIKRITESGLTRREKISIYALVLAMLTPVFILSKSLHLRIFLVVLMVVKAIFFLRIKTAPRTVPEQAGEPGEDEENRVC